VCYQHLAFFIVKILPSLVRAPGFEPGTYRVSVDCSSQLSYARTKPVKIKSIDNSKNIAKNSSFNNDIFYFQKSAIILKSFKNKFNKICRAKSRKLLEEKF